MRRHTAVIGSVLIALLATGCAREVKVPEEREVTLAPTKDAKSETQGKAVIRTQDEMGTVTINATGLDPKGVYTAFLVNPKSQMFQGLGSAPHVLTVGANGECTFTCDVPKETLARFVTLGVYLNPGGQPIENPVGVKAALGSLVARETPKLILEGKLR